MRTLYFTFTQLMLITSCFGQSGATEFKIFEDKETGWSASYPDYLNVLSEAEIAAYEGRGQGALEETIGQEIEYKHKNLIWLMKDRFNSFSAVSQPYDIEIDGPYEENEKTIKEIIVETYKNQGIEFDYEFGTYAIDGLVFGTITTKLYTPDRSKVILTQIIFDRLLDKSRTLTLHIAYNNPMDREILMRIIDSGKLTIRN